MSAEKRSPRKRLALRALAILPALAILICSGCSKADPVNTLYKADVQIKFRDKHARQHVETLKFPPSADDKLVALLTGRTFSKIREIDLSDTQITNDALETIGKLESLQTLNLTNTAIDGEGLKHLSELSNLLILRIGDTNVKGEDLKELYALKSLQSLSLSGKVKPKEPKERDWSTAFKLGIDLGGGTNLVYQVVETDEKKITSEVMDQMVAAVKRRIDPSGTQEITVRKVGTERIEVIIPRADPEVVAEKKRLMTRLGSLEFAILANTNRHQELIDKARGIERDYRVEKIINGEKTSVLRAGWRDVALDAEGKPKEIGFNGNVQFRPHPTNKDLMQYLVVFGDPSERMLGKYLKRASPGTDSNGRPSVNFQWNTRGATLFARLTGDYLPPSGESGFHHRLAILLDGQIHSAPQIITQISDRGDITGSFTKEEVDELVSVLNAGALALPFKPGANGQPAPISEQTISPLLGKDVREKGQFAILVAAGVVFVFMLVYYLFAGLVADLSLLLNLVLVMGVMAFIDAAFTLPGLAGIVLTIGMAVDANVLIFERIREERNRGSSLRMSIQQGFGRAFTTIVDANITTLITAVVLYMIGTDQVRGFAVTLFIGIVMSMFASLYFGRLLFDICERKRILKDVKMNSIVGATSWNFINKKSIAAVISAIVIIAGIGGVFSRGRDLLDIDLDGGSMVTVVFEKEQEVDDLKQQLSKSEILEDGLTIEQITSTTLTAEEFGYRFRIRGKEKEPEKFKDAIYDTLMAADASKYQMRQVRLQGYDAKQIQTVKKTQTGLVPTEFIDGHRLELGFTGAGMKAATFEALVRDKISSLQAGPGTQKYTNAGDLIRVDPLTASGELDTSGNIGESKKVRLYVKKDVTLDDLTTSLAGVQKDLATKPIFPEVNNFDSSVASDMQNSAILAMLFSLVAIVAYIWFRFQRATFGIAAVVALVHDVLVVLGVVALAGFVGGPWLDFKINLPMIAAFLTIVGYSLNDTIVVFDRVREVRGKNPALTDDMVNTSLNQTLSRTLLTSLTTLIVVIILYGWGGEGIRGFAFCLVLGVLVGTYSSIYVASPVLLWLMNRPGSETGRASAAAAGR